MEPYPVTVASLPFAVGPSRWALHGGGLVRRPLFRSDPAAETGKAIERFLSMVWRSARGRYVFDAVVRLTEGRSLSSVVTWTSLRLLVVGSGR